jgi:triosephosphate isomerase
VLAEAAKAAGAKGTLLNHAERPLPLATLARTIHRAGEAGLATMVCADSVPEVTAIANLGPDIILAEPPDLIGGTSSVADVMADFVRDAVRAAARVNPRIKVMCSAGIRTPEDAASVIQLGAHATGSTSGILLADDPVAQMRAMIRAVRRAWDERKPTPIEG